MTRFLLNHLLESSANRYPDRAAVVDRDRSVTYAELDRRANQLAHTLLDGHHALALLQSLPEPGLFSPA